MQARTILSSTQLEGLQVVADNQRLAAKLSMLASQLTNSALTTAPSPAN
jgi:hypothetical protein